MEQKFKTREEAHAYLRTLQPHMLYRHKTAEIRNAVLGKNVGIGAYAVIGNAGFGMDPKAENCTRFPHNGRVIIGDHVEIGSNSCIDRGTIGDTVIGNYTKIDNLVHIAHNAQIGENCLIVAGTVVGGSCKIGNNVFIGERVCIKDHVKIGSNVVVGQGSNVLSDVPSGVVVVGNPAKVLRQILIGKDPLPLGWRPDL